jgi:hypothetical protein
MVMFHPEIPYAEAQRRGAAQQRVLEQLLPDAEAVSAGQVARARIETLLDQAEL